MRSLLLKDFLVVKRYIAIMLVVGAALPPLMLASMSESDASLDAVASLSFMIAAVYVAAMSLLQLAQKESANHEAMALLCTTPVRRSSFVLSTYVFVYALVAILVGIYLIESLFLPPLRVIPPLLPSATFCLLALLIGTVIPLLYGLGFDRTKMIMPIILMATPFIIPWALTHTSLLAWMQKGAPGAQAALWAGGSVYLAGSVWLSVRLFARADIR